VELLDAYDRGVLKTTTPSRQEIDRIKAMARNTFRQYVEGDLVESK
jgi:hypothetical protein